MIVENDYDHDIALQQTGFWGRAAAGCIIMARTTGRILLQLRGDVEEPGTWGTWGGAIDEGSSPKQTVKKEFEEETGKSASSIREMIPLHVFSHPSGFKYHNFLITVDDEFTPRPDESMAFEIDGFRWVDFGDWPKPLHFGLENLIKQDGKKIQDIVDRNSRGEKLTEGILYEHTKLQPQLTYQQLARNKTVTAFHASEDSNFIPDNDMTLHVGSLQQSLDLISNMKKQLPNQKFYLYEMSIEIGRIAPYLFDEDPTEEIGGGVGEYSYDTYPYINRIEFPKGARMGSNISLLLTRPEQQIVGKKLVKTV